MVVKIAISHIKTFWSKTDQSGVCEVKKLGKKKTNVRGLSREEIGSNSSSGFRCSAEVDLDWPAAKDRVSQLEFIEDMASAAYHTMSVRWTASDMR